MDEFYDVKMICTYPEIDDELQDDLYRIQFLQAFKLSEWNDQIINDKIEKIFNFLNNDIDVNKNIDEILSLICKSENYNSLILLFGDDKLCQFKLLFGFDLFSIFHTCIGNYFNNGSIKEDDILKLKNKINSF